MTPEKNLPPPRRDRTSVLLRGILAGIPEDEVSLGDIVLDFRRRSFGGILLVLTVLGLIPVISFFAALILIIPGAQMAVGFQTPHLPRVIAGWRIASSRVQSLGRRSLPWIERAEDFIRPRWLFLTMPPMPMLIGIVVVGLALVLFLPLPLVNIPPAIALIFLSLGILERDGVMVAIGLIAAAAALCLGVFAATLAVEALKLLLRAHGG